VFPSVEYHPDYPTEVEFFLKIRVDVRQNLKLLRGEDILEVITLMR
jgi:hypothetical protein